MDGAEVHEDKPPALLSRVVLWACLALYRWKGWRLEGARPSEPKFVITGVPHTSNWDFIFFVGATHELGIRPSFVGKVSLFRGFLRRFMFDMGGLPVDRSKRGSNYVEQIAAHFSARRELALVIAPEGSRGTDGSWRSGTYHIATRAGVPIVPAWVDNARRRGGVGPAIHLTGDYGADLARIAAYYRSVMPDCARFRVLAAQAKTMIEGKHDA